MIDAVLRLSYAELYLAMSSTLTFRLSDADRKKLRRRATDLGKTESEFIRELLKRELDDRPLGERAAHVFGSLAISPHERDERARDIRSKNWRR